MQQFASHITRGLALTLAVTLFGALALVVLPGIIVAQDAPAADCDSGPNVACPAPGDANAQYVGSVTALPDGVVLLLTDAGLGRARECGGPAEIAAMAQALYDALPAEQKAEVQLDWTGGQLLDEIYGHAFLNELSGGVPGMGSIYERSNPINIDFADYGGPGTMTAEASAEQATFAALGAVHRAAC